MRWRPPPRRRTGGARSDPGTEEEREEEAGAGEPQRARRAAEGLDVEPEGAPFGEGSRRSRSID
jgi:hypothetical protein